jgi:hypothetical protein
VAEGKPRPCNTRPFNKRSATSRYQHLTRALLFGELIMVILLWTVPRGLNFIWIELIEKAN